MGSHILHTCFRWGGSSFVSLAGHRHVRGARNATDYDPECETRSERLTRYGDSS
jgi:hypothetical protein